MPKKKAGKGHSRASSRAERSSDGASGPRANARRSAAAKGAQVRPRGQAAEIPPAKRPRQKRPVERPTKLKPGASRKASAAVSQRPAQPVGSEASSTDRKSVRSGRQPAKQSKAAVAPAPVRKSRATAARPRAGRSRKAAADAGVEAAQAGLVPALTEEEQIGSAKYLPRDLPPRLFEEERFLFPESYGQDRVRLLVKDPEWIFAYWDVNPQSVAALRSDLGDRATALSRLTLRLIDPDTGGTMVILLPEGARSWYVRADRGPRAYRADLGFTLPSGEFRPLAQSNTVHTPRVGASKEKATRRAHYKKLREKAAQAALSQTAQEAASSPAPRPRAADASVVTYAGADVGPGAAGSPIEGEPDASQPGGASDVFRPGGASDVLPRGGASDVHRR